MNKQDIAMIYGFAKAGLDNEEIREEALKSIVELFYRKGLSEHFQRQNKVLR